MTMVNLNNNLTPQKRFELLLKEYGYEKKSKQRFIFQTEYNDRLFISLQKSRYEEGFLINIGVWFPIDESFSEGIDSYDLHLTSRFGRITGEKDLFTSKNVEDVLKKMEEVVLPELTKVSDYSYLKESIPDNFNFNTWWLQNITEETLIEYLKSK